MQVLITADGAANPVPAPPPAMVFLLASSCGIIVANIYGVQPLIALIDPYALPPQWYLHGHLLIGGAAGWALLSPVLAHYGWAGICTIGAGLPLLALVHFILHNLGAHECLA